MTNMHRLDFNALMEDIDSSDEKTFKILESTSALESSAFLKCCLHVSHRGEREELHKWCAYKKSDDINLAKVHTCQCYIFLSSLQNMT